MNNEYSYGVDDGKVYSNQKLKDYTNIPNIKNDYVTIVVNRIDHTISFEINFVSKGVAYSIDQDVETYYFCVAMYKEN